MLLLLLVIYLRSSTALLISTENRISTRNITCQHDIGLLTTISLNCEACLITSRNYPIESALSLAGSGPTGVSYTCLQVNEVEIYHENLIRECRYFPRDTLNGYDDFCVASPYSYVRGSYRACICLTNACNFNYTRCTRQANPYWNGKTPLFSNTIVELTQKVKCYQPYDNSILQTHSSLIPLCSNEDVECKNYLVENGVLCTISVDQANQISRQTLTPSIYSAYIIKYKTELCNSFKWTSKSIYFSQCEVDNALCMCALDDCDKDLETCRTSGGVCKNYYFVSSLFVFVLNIYI